MGRRLPRLSGDANQVLRIAAVVGHEFELGVVQAAGDLSEETLLGAVEEAAHARLVQEVSATSLPLRPRPGARHALRIAHRGPHGHAPPQGGRSHRSDPSSALDDYLPTLAHHWAKASASPNRLTWPLGRTTRAVEYAQLAGDRALAQLAHDEAARYYASGLELLDAGGADPTDARRLELLIGRGEAQRRAGDPGYRQILLDAAHLAEKVGDASALARAALANTLGSMWTAFTVDTDRIEVLESAISAAGGEDPALRARLLATLGLELAWQPDPTRRVALSQEALQIARTIDDPATLAHVLLARDYTITDPENVTERFDNTTELLALAERLGDPVVASRALSLRFKVAIERADVAEAERSLVRNEALIADLGQPGLAFFVLHHRASLAVLHGDPDAEQRHNAADELGRSVAVGGTLAAQDILSRVRLFTLRVEQGRVDEISGFWRDMYMGLGGTAAPGFIQAAYAHGCLDEGELEVAAGLLDEFAAAGFVHPRHTLGWLLFMVQCAAVTAGLGRKDCVPPLRSALEPYADQLVIAGFAGWIGGSVSLYLAMLAATAGDYPQAEVDFAAAAATHERIGAPMWLARTRVEWARMLLARGAAGDTERATELLGPALATARDLGLEKIERDAAALLSGS